MSLVRAAVVVSILLLPAPASAGTVFLLDGRGWGHGVGMSQWGAEGYARHGWSYDRILAHYYPGTRLEAWHPKAVRVLLAPSAAAARLGSAAPFVVVDGNGRTLHLPPRAVVLDRRFLLRKHKLVPPLRFRPGAQPLTYQLRGYRGDLVVKQRGAKLMVVNELPLDRYLRGVVPSEVPKGWQPETYRAQAVAARTYALATLHPRKDFDLLPDVRDQVYGGIAAERDHTNLAIGSTAGQVLTYGGRLIIAYYFSSSGGRTSSVHDAWPRSPQVPYLVSVADPYDYLSPHHAWPTRIFSAAELGRKLGAADASDVVVERNSSGRAVALRLNTAAGWKQVPAEAARKRLGLRSTDFGVRAMSLEEPSRPAVFGDRLTVTGWLRGLGRARLQMQTETGWRVVARVRPRADGHFSIPVRATASTRYRIAYNGLAGVEVSLNVTPRVDIGRDGTRLRVRVAPALPLRVERLTRAEWRPVARARGAFLRELGPGSYRVAVTGEGGYRSTVSPAVGLH